MRADTFAIASFASSRRPSRTRKNITMTTNIITTSAVTFALAAALAGCAATQPPPLSANNPASAEAREGRTSPPPRLRADDELTKKANARLAGDAPVQPQYQPTEMGKMPGSEHESMNMGGEQKPAKSYWTCVMHPQVRQDKPGKCPICGMTLVEKKEGR